MKDLFSSLNRGGEQSETCGVVRFSAKSPLSREWLNPLLSVPFETALRDTPHLIDTVHPF